MALGIKTGGYGGAATPVSSTIQSAYNGKLPARFYAKSFVVGVLIGGVLEFIMCKTGFYRGMRKSEARRIIAELDAKE